jgi:DNA-binding CsgD family transcriptional regulator
MSRALRSISGKQPGAVQTAPKSLPPVKRPNLTESTKSNIGSRTTSADDRSFSLVHLSSREKDCLLWAAKGKSSWDIGLILGVSESTVNFHIKNAMKKLDTTSRTVAVIKAIQLYLIDLPSL